MSAELELRAPENSEVARLRAAKDALRDGEADFVFATRLWAESLGAAARAKRAADVAREAAETLVRCERRLGEIAQSDPDSLASLEISPARLGTWQELARIPEHIFEETVAEMAARGRSCAAAHVVANARRATLRKREPGIWVSWDGKFFTELDGKQWPHPFADIERVREDLRRSVGMRKSWHTSSISTNLDDLHARSRRLAQALSLVGPTVTGDMRHLVSEAERLQGEVARLLWEAWETGRLAA